LDDPRGSEPGLRRPVLVVQSDAFDAPGNVLLPLATTGLPKDSVANVTQVVTLDEDYLTERTGRIPPQLMERVGAGLRLVMDL
jgi:mRNA interferase MazF